MPVDIELGRCRFSTHGAGSRGNHLSLEFPLSSDELGVAGVAPADPEKTEYQSYSPYAISIPGIGEIQGASKNCGSTEDKGNEGGGEHCIGSNERPKDWKSKEDLGNEGPGW